MLAPLFVTYFTDDYETSAANLCKSFKKFRLDFLAKRVEDQGSWQANTHLKPQFVWDCLTKDNPKHRPIIWVDADAEIIQDPVLFTSGRFAGDVGICRWSRPDAKPETLSGTVFFRGNQNSIRLVDRWITTCAENPTLWDQNCLGMAIEALPEVAVELLPLEYCWIYDRFRELYPDRSPVIEHYQMSRKTRFRVPTRKQK